MSVEQLLTSLIPLKTKSVLSPLLWFNATASLAFGSIVVFGPSEFKLLSFAALCVVYVYFLTAHTYFVLIDPQRLHSEGHREEIAKIDRARS